MATLGAGIFAGGMALIVYSHNIKMHAEKFRSDKGPFIQQKLNMLLKDLYINHIFTSLIEIDFLSKISQKTKGDELKKELSGFLKELIAYLDKRKALSSLKDKIEKITEIFIEDSRSFEHIKERATNILELVEEHNFNEKMFEDAYIYEIKESKQLFRFSIVFAILGLSIIGFSLMYCNIETSQIAVTIPIFITFSEGYALLLLGGETYKNRKKKNKLHEKIFKIEQESLGISRIEK